MLIIVSAIPCKAFNMSSNIHISVFKQMHEIFKAKKQNKQSQNRIQATGINRNLQNIPSISNTSVTEHTILEKNVSHTDILVFKSSVTSNLILHGFFWLLQKRRHYITTLSRYPPCQDESRQKKKRMNF